MSPLAEIEVAIHSIICSLADGFDGVIVDAFL